MSGSRKWPVWLGIAAIGAALVGVLFDRGLGGREPSRPHPLRPATRDALAGTRETATNHHAQSDALLVADHRKPAG
jgi:hypothetical protein